MKFPSLASVDWSMVQTADVLQISGFVPGGIFHSEHLIWRADMSGCSDPTQLIRSKRDQQSHQKAMAFFTEQGMHVKTLPMTESLFQEFRVLYDDTTMIRERPIRFDLDSLVLGKIKVNQPVYLIGLFEQKKLISGLIFSVYNDKVSVSYGAKRKFGIRGGAGGVFEHELAQFCLEHGYTDVTHGTATNPVGLYTRAGVFEFKVRYGYTAYPMGRWVTSFIQHPEAALSEFVFVGMAPESVEYTIVSDLEPKEIKQKYATREPANIRVLSKAQVTKQFEKLTQSV